MGRSNKEFFHGTKANLGINGFVFPGPSGFAYATSDPEQAQLYGQTKFNPEDKDNPVRVFKVIPVQPDEATEYEGEKPGETHMRTGQGFMITGEHNG